MPTEVTSPLTSASPFPSHTSTPQPSHTPFPAPSSTPSRPAPPSHTATPSPTPGLPPLLPPSSGDPIPLSLDWRLDANGHLTGASIIYRDDQPLLLLASLGRTVYALRDNGQVAWRLRTGGPVYALAPVQDNQVAVGDDTGMVALVDAHGRQLWRHSLGSRVTALHGAWQGGVLAGGWDEHLTLLGNDGEVQWQAGLNGVLSSISLLPDLAVAATLDGQIWAFDPGGTEVWRLETDAPVTGLEATGVEKTSSLLVGLQDGRLLALDAGGRPRWQQTLGTGAPLWHVADLADDIGPEIIVGTGGSEPILALLSAEGRVLWRQAVPSPVGAVTSLDLEDDGTPEILAGLHNGEVRAYDSQGHLRALAQAGLSVWELQAVEDGSALILADVVAWRLVGRSGETGGPWLRPPTMVHVPPDSLPDGTERAGQEAILVFLGDVSSGRSMEAQLARYGPAYPWEGLGPLLREADLAVANLEGVLTTQGKPLDKPYLIRSHPQSGRTLREAGFDLVTLANNHALDFGLPGLDETLSTLQALEIPAVGAGPSPEIAHRPALFNLNGVRVAVLGYAAARWNGSVDVPATDRLAWAEPRAVQADVRTIRGQVDLVVVLLHAGTEYAAAPSADQVAVAHAAIDAGADLVIGHHPHITQSVERYRQGFIVYSLGDALFDIPRSAAMQGELLRVHATQAGLGQVELWPFWIKDSIQPLFLADDENRPRFRIIYP